MSAKIPYSTFRPGVSRNLYAILGGKIIRRGRRYHRYKGYHRPGLFSGGSRQIRFSNRRFLLTLIVIAGGVALMIWGLSYAKGAV